MILNRLRKRLYFLILPVLTISLLAGLSCGGGGGNDSGDRSFYAANFVTNYYYIVNANLVYNGTYCKVYKAVGDNYISDATAIAMGEEFDSAIYNQITNSFGNPSDEDGDNKITILFLDIKDGFTGSGGYIAGYFDPTNLFDKSTYPASNECDMLYMDTYPGYYNLDAVKETMAHEYQHLINFNVKYFVQGAGEFDTWINEGMSSAAEKIYSGVQIQSKIDNFNDDYDGNIAQSLYFVTWMNELANYSSVYLFFQWLSINASNGDLIYKDIMDSSDTDYRAVVAAAQSRFSGFSGTWGDLFRHWLVANVLESKTGAATYSYDGQITPEISLIDPSIKSGGACDLYPGCAVYISTSGTHTLSSSGDIAYAGINTSTGAVDTTDNSFSGDIFIAYNIKGTEPASSSDYATTGTLPSLLLFYPELSYNTKALRASADSERIYPLDHVQKIGGGGMKNETKKAILNRVGRK